MEDQVHEFAVALSEINCGECGGVYAINERFRKHKEKKGGYWNCPYCQTGWGYGESENDRLKKRLEAEKERKQRALEEANELRRSLSAQKAATTRAKKRHAAGVCPCCSRSFKQLRQHMERMHPDYKTDSA